MKPFFSSTNCCWLWHFYISNRKAAQCWWSHVLIAPWCCDQCHDPAQLGEESSICLTHPDDNLAWEVLLPMSCPGTNKWPPYYNSLSLREFRAGTETANTGKRHIGLFSMTRLAYFPRITCPWMALSRMNWSLPHQSLVNKIPNRYACRSIWWR